MGVEGVLYIRFYQRERKQDHRRDAMITHLTVSAPGAITPGPRCTRP